jgi:predicted RNase H-like HicB family nuclease
MTDSQRYPAHVFWSDEDEAYIAVATDLPGCSAIGNTQADALSELQDAIAAWIEAQRAVGNPIPAPSSPARDHSGKILIRIPRSLHAKLAFTANTEGVSLNQYILHLLSLSSEGPSLPSQTVSVQSGSSTWNAIGGAVSTTVHGSTGSVPHWQYHTGTVSALPKAKQRATR